MKVARLWPNLLQRSPMLFSSIELLLTVQHVTTPVKTPFVAFALSSIPASAPGVACARQRAVGGLSGTAAHHPLSSIQKTPPATRPPSAARCGLLPLAPNRRGKSPNQRSPRAPRLRGVPHASPAKPGARIPIGQREPNIEGLVM